MGRLGLLTRAMFISALDQVGTTITIFLALPDLQDFDSIDVNLAVLLVFLLAYRLLRTVLSEVSQRQVGLSAVVPCKPMLPCSESFVLLNIQK